MTRKCLFRKAVALLLSLLTATITAPFSPAETFAASPLGAIITAGSVSIGGASAPTGTTVFSGDRVATPSSPALINLISGSRIELINAAVTVSRQNGLLSVQASQGLLRFNFKSDDPVEFNTGKYRFRAVGNGTSQVGELALNQRGQLVMNVTQGVFAAENTATGERSEVLAGKPLIIMEQTGQGSVTKGGKTLTDLTKTWQPDELKGKCLVAGTEAYHIVGNTANTITIKGSWKLKTGNYEYKITDCTKEALIAAGASAAAAASAATAAAAAAAAGAAGAAVGISTAAVVGIVAGTAAAVGVGIGVATALKSP